MNETEENIPEANHKPGNRLINNYMSFEMNILLEHMQHCIFATV